MSFTAGQACALCTRSIRNTLLRCSYASSFSTSAAPSGLFSMIPGRTSRPGAEGIQALRDTIDEAAEAGAASGSVVHNIQAKNDDRARIAAGEARQRRLDPAETLRPTDISARRMYPSNAHKHRSVLTQTSLGPKRKDALERDYFVQHGNLNPLDFTMNVPLLSRFVTNTGKIMNRAQTQLTWKNQKRMGKAVRRARAMGAMPYFGDWSEHMIKNTKARQRGMWATGRDITG